MSLNVWVLLETALPTEMYMFVGSFLQGSRTSFDLSHVWGWGLGTHHIISFRGYMSFGFNIFKCFERVALSIQHLPPNRLC